VHEPSEPRAPTPVARPYNLTAKESEVLALLVQGYTNRLIASALHMTEKTASVHVSRILAKLSVRSRGEAVARAFEVGLATVPREY
jgi:DNA-binding NarL/FixJ family response regulator